MNLTKPHSRKYVLTGRLRSGKDFAAKHCGGTILGFADPLYAVGKALFGLGVDKKDDPKADLRGFYQKLGEWGKGTFDDQHPLTMDRAAFILLMRAHGNELCDMPVDWRSYGRNQNIWLESLLGRAFVLTGENNAPLDGPFYPERDVFVTNARFRFELDELRKSDFDHFHSMCSEPTYIERLRQVGMSLGDQRLKHVSEMLANDLDRQVNNLLRLHPTGPKLKVIWNDDRPSPSDRLFTLDEFKKYVKDNGTRPKEDPAPDCETYPEPSDSAGPVVESAEASDASESPGDLANAAPKGGARKPKARNSRKGS